MFVRKATWFAIAMATIVNSHVHSEEVQPRIAWYGTVKSGLAEAKRTNKPILFVSAAPHCLGVPGEW